MEGNGDIGLIASLMPNQTRANLMRATAWFCLSISLLFGLPLARIVFHDLYARVSWPVADGAVRGYQQESGEEHASGTRSTSGASWPVYWIEFEVGLDIPAGNCRTGTTIGGRAELPCVGTIRTPATKSWAEAQSWVARHPPNSRGRFLYDLSGPGVRFADEPVWTLYPMGRIVLFLGLTACSALFLATTERRLRELKALPEHYHASPPPTAEASDPNAPIELRLS